MEGLFGFVLAGFALAASPGPATMSLAAVGAAFGARRGLGYLAGIMVGAMIVMGVIATGVMGILLAWPGATPVLSALGAAYIFYLAFRIATAPPFSESANQNHRPAFVGGMFLNLVNPKAYAVFTALFSGFVLVEENLRMDAALKFIILLGILSFGNIFWLLVGTALTGFVRDPAISRAINVIFAVLLVAAVALSLLF